MAPWYLQVFGVDIHYNKIHWSLQVNKYEVFIKMFSNNWQIAEHDSSLYYAPLPNIYTN